jgi:hypothetical protein
VSADELAGTWTKVGEAPCSSSYPDELELRRGGGYVGRKRPGAREHSRWDVGSYRVLDDGRLGVSLSNGGLGRYAFTLAGDELRLIDEEGCAFAYRRVRGE